MANNLTFPDLVVANDTTATTSEELRDAVNSIKTTVNAINGEISSVETEVDGNTSDLVAIKGSLTAAEAGQVIANAVQSTDYTSIVEMTQAEYDAITPDSSVLYVIVG